LTQYGIALQPATKQHFSITAEAALFQQNPLFIGKTTGSSVARKFPFFSQTFRKTHIGIFL